MKLIYIFLQKIIIQKEKKVKVLKKTIWPITSHLWKLLYQIGGYFPPHGSYSNMLSNNSLAKRTY